MALSEFLNLSLACFIHLWNGNSNNSSHLVYFVWLENQALITAYDSQKISKCNTLKWKETLNHLSVWFLSFLSSVCDMGVLVLFSMTLYCILLPMWPVTLTFMLLVMIFSLLGISFPNHSQWLSSLKNLSIVSVFIPELTEIKEIIIAVTIIKS